MGYATGARSRLIYCAEATEGAGVPTTPSWKTARRTAGGSGISIGASTLESAELRSDRQSQAAQRGNKTIAISVPFELSYGTFDDWLESLLASSWATDILQNGTTRKSFVFEEGYLDLSTPEYQAVLGVIASKLSLAIKNNAKVTGSFDFLGLTANDIATASLLSSSTLADPSTTSAFDSFTGAISEGGSTFEAAQSLDISIDASAAAKYALYKDDPAFNSLGRFKITGSLITFYKDKTLLQKFLDGASSSISWVLQDAAGNKYTIEIPHIVYTGASKTIPEEDIPITLQFSAGVDSVSGKMIKITRDAA